MTYEVSIHPTTGRVLLTGNGLVEYDVGSVVDARANWPDLAAEIDRQSTTWAQTRPAPSVSPGPSGPGGVSRRQFFQALTKAPHREISETEALAAVSTGVVPASLKAVLDQAESLGLFPAGTSRFDVDIMLAGATTFDRFHPVTALIAGMWGWTEAELDAFFAFAGALI